MYWDCGLFQRLDRLAQHRNIALGTNSGLNCRASAVSTELHKYLPSSTAPQNSFNFGPFAEYDGQVLV